MSAEISDQTIAGRYGPPAGSAQSGRDPDPTRRLKYVQASSSGDDLVVFVDDPSPEVARAAVRRLVTLVGPSAAPALRRCLLDVDLALVPDLAQALHQLSDRQAVDLAMAGLRDERYTRRVAAAIALGVFADARSADALRRSLTDEIAAVRAAALRSLSRLGISDFGAESTALLSDRDPQVRIAAIRAVVQLLASPGSAIASAARDDNCLVRIEVARHASRLPADAAAHLLTDTEALVRQAAADAGGVRQVRLLGKLLASDADVGVRRAAAHALGNLIGDDVTEALMVGIGDGDPVVRAATLRALERTLGRDGSTRRITRELTHSSPGRRRAALYALSHLTARDVGCEVWRLTDDPDAQVRFAVIDTAAILVGECDVLLSYMATDPDPAVRASAEHRRLRAVEGR